MNEANFVSRISWFATGDSFLAERDLGLTAMRDASTGAPLGVEGDATSTPSGGVDGISFDDGETAVLQFAVPLDYDPEGDRLAVRLLVRPSADSSDTTDIGLTAAQHIWRAGEAEDTTAASAVAEDATASDDQLTREVVLDISGGEYQPGDVVQRVLDANNSGTTELVVVGVSLIYGSTLRMYDTAQNERDLGE